MIRESISTWITVVGIFIADLATLAIWLREHYAKGALQDIVPVVGAMFFLSCSIIVALYLLYYSASEFENEDQLRVKHNPDHVFMVLYGVAANMVLVGVFVLFAYFGFAFSLDNIHPEQSDHCAINNVKGADHTITSSSTSQQSDTLNLAPHVRKEK